VVFALSLAILPAAQARVFFRWGARDPSARALAEAGGRLAYQSKVRINNGAGDLSVFGFEASLDDVARDLRRLFGLPPSAFAGGSFATANATSEGRHLRFILLQPSSRVQTLVFKIEQSAEEHRASGQPPTGHLLTEVPPFPGSVPSFYMLDDSTSTAIAIASTTAAAGEVHDFYRSRLAAEGWQPALPGTAGPTAGGAVVYLRGPEICCCYADTGRDGGATRITLLHKRQGVK
jgi:hypothetical protein